MSLYNLIRDHCNIIRAPNDKLTVGCNYCGKSLYSTMLFDWETWNYDMLGTFTTLESKVTYHLLFKCKTTTKKK